MPTERPLKTSMIALLVLAVMISACSPRPAPEPGAQPAASPSPSQAEAITLNLAVSDDNGSPSEPYVLEFVNQVKDLSGGKITVAAAWNAGNDTPAGFEIGVIQLVQGGKFDLGLAASRAFDKAGIGSFEALQAPFLITDDNLAKAAAASDLASQMLDSLPSNGLTGLTLWPEDLRHPFSISPAKPLLSPADFAGQNIRTTPSGVSEMLVRALGGTPMFDDSGYQGAESGLRQLSSLSAGTPTATGNVTFFAKYQVLFGNEAALNKLSAAQRTILLKAAEATQQKAIAEHPSEADASKAWCADGLAIVMASDQQVAAFQAAAQPVLAQIEQDPLNAKLVAEIRDLKAKTPPAPGAEPCAPAAALPSPEPTKAVVWSKGLPPNGVWQATLTVDDLVRMGVPRSIAAGTGADNWTGLYTFSFQSGTYVATTQDAQGNIGKCQAHYALAGDDIVRLTYFQQTPPLDECPGEVDDIQWRIDSDGLHFHLVDISNGPLTEMAAVYEAKPWRKVH